mmetsp:Transcript_21014/g.49298  ORF Transcript_21014/g.49298 Transcript_21014/m.49298 type:complete len:217 (-) Transcript_21014:21-671(-)
MVLDEVRDVIDAVLVTHPDPIRRRLVFGHFLRREHRPRLGFAGPGCQLRQRRPDLREALLREASASSRCPLPALFDEVDVCRPLRALLSRDPGIADVHLLLLQDLRGLAEEAGSVDVHPETDDAGATGAAGAALAGGPASVQVLAGKDSGQSRRTRGPRRMSKRAPPSLLRAAGARAARAGPPCPPCEPATQASRHGHEKGPSFKSTKTSSSAGLL